MTTILEEKYLSIINNQKITKPEFVKFLEQEPDLSLSIFHEEKGHDDDTLYSFIVKSLFDDRVSLLSQIQKQGFDVSQIKFKKLISDINFSALYNSKKENSLIIENLVKEHKNIDNYSYARLFVEEPELSIKIKKWKPELDYVKIFTSFIVDYLMKHLYASCDSNKYLNANDYISRMHKDGIFEYSQIKNGFYCANEIINANNSYSQSKFNTFLQEEIKPFVDTILEKNIILDHINHNHYYSNHKKRI